MSVYKISAKDNSGKVVRLTCEATSEEEAHSYAIESGYKPIAIINNNSSPNKTEKEIRQQAQLQEFKSSNRKINCTACRNSISINAVACPKCGQPITDKARLDEIARINRNQMIIVALIIGFILLVLIGKLLPERPGSQSSQTSTDSSSPSSSYSSSEAERTRKELEREEIRRKRDALQPILKEGCIQGNQEACRQYKEWEDMR